jgi:hypothetical protein
VIDIAGAIARTVASALRNIVTALSALDFAMPGSPGSIHGATACIFRHGGREAVFSTGSIALGAPLPIDVCLATSVASFLQRSMPTGRFRLAAERVDDVGESPGVHSIPASIR